MNSILIFGSIPNSDMNTIFFNLHIYAQQKGGDLTYISHRTIKASSFSDMWDQVKSIVSKHFLDQSFKDGFYTKYFEHLNM